MGVVPLGRMALTELIRTTDTPLNGHTTEMPILFCSRKCSHEGRPKFHEVIWGRLPGGEEMFDQLCKVHLVALTEKGEEIQVGEEGVVWRQEDVESWLSTAGLCPCWCLGWPGQ